MPTISPLLPIDPSTAAFNPSRADIRCTRRILARRLPIELVVLILHEARYYTRVVGVMRCQLTGTRNYQQFVRTPPVWGRVMEVKITIESQEPGPIDPELNASHDATTRFDAIIRKQDGSEGGCWEGIARNRRGDTEWQTHNIQWKATGDHPLVKKIGAGDVIEMAGRGRSVDWTRHVRFVLVEVFCWDSGDITPSEPVPHLPPRPRMVKNARNVQ